jgi:carbon-monoxide dehydrogenase medium subunit
MYETTYVRAGDLSQARQLFLDNPEAQLLAGGQTLVLTMRQRLARASHVIDITHLAELKGISLDHDRLVIGASTRHAEVAANADVRRLISGLAQLADGIGDPAVRHMGTIGGSIANNDPAADYPAAVLALGATIKTNKRSIAADDFFKGLFTTALQDGEILTAVSFPIPAKAGYSKMPHPASRFALTGVFVAKTKSGDVRVAATGASSSGVMRVPAIEAALKANWSPGALDSVTISADGLLSDIQGSSSYRANLIKVMAQRAVTAAG